MEVVTQGFVKDKKVLLRYDIDVALRLAPLAQGKPADEREMVVSEDFKLKAGLSTLRFCLENASKVIIIGHLGRPAPPEERDEPPSPSPDLSAKPIQEWLQQELGQDVELATSLEEAAKSTSTLVLLENIRFFHGEVEASSDFAHKLASLGDVYVNEAFSAHTPAASTTIVPTLMPHAAGLHFIEEVRVLREVRDNPKKPFVAIMGGAKVEDKLPVIGVLAKNADAVLVGGKLASEFTFDDAIAQQNMNNVLIGKLNEDGMDIAAETTESWRNLIMGAKMIVWNGPLGKFEDPKYDQSKKVAEMVLESGAE
ncbi:hypothetical protein A3B45_01795, partial [Candidatus Daviesbacteria bacterium RIFCSPLOWO2_01_FULL_39_12]